jgi:choline-glycine betaine transporter
VTDEKTRQTAAESVAAEESAATGRSLAEVRKRRRFLWGVLIAYLPIMSLAERVSPTLRSTVIAYFTWIALLFAAGFYAALARCPRCGNYFHMHGLTLLFLRKCLHCQLHITADS